MYVLACMFSLQLFLKLTIKISQLDYLTRKQLRQMRSHGWHQTKFPDLTNLDLVLSPFQQPHPQQPSVPTISMSLSHLPPRDLMFLQPFRQRRRHPLQVQPRVPRQQHRNRFTGQNQRLRLPVGDRITSPHPHIQILIDQLLKVTPQLQLQRYRRPPRLEIATFT